MLAVRAPRELLEGLVVLVASYMRVMRAVQAGVGMPFLLVFHPRGTSSHEAGIGASLVGPGVRGLGAFDGSL